MRTGSFRAGPLARWVLLSYLAISLASRAAAHMDQTSPASTRGDGPNVVLLHNNVIQCPISEGETTFIVSSPTGADLESLVILVANEVARGELNIAVSDDKIATLSGKWRTIDGIIHFTHKRLLNVSLVGVEAKYAKLVFRIRNPVPLETFSSSRLTESLNLSRQGVFIRKAPIRRVANGSPTGRTAQIFTPLLTL